MLGAEPCPKTGPLGFPFFFSFPDLLLYFKKIRENNGTGLFLRELPVLTRTAIVIGYVVLLR